MLDLFRFSLFLMLALLAPSSAQKVTVDVVEPGQPVRTVSMQRQADGWKLVDAGSGQTFATYKKSKSGYVLTLSDDPQPHPVPAPTLPRLADRKPAQLAMQGHQVEVTRLGDCVLARPSDDPIMLLMQVGR